MGKLSALRHRTDKPRTQPASLQAMKNTARKGGVKRVAKMTLTEFQADVPRWLAQLCETAVCYTDSGKRGTVVANDVIHAAKKMGIHVYGMDNPLWFKDGPGK